MDCGVREIDWQFVSHFSAENFDLFTLRSKTKSAVPMSIAGKAWTSFLVNIWILEKCATIAEMSHLHNKIWFQGHFGLFACFYQSIAISCAADSFIIPVQLINLHFTATLLIHLHFIDTFPVLMIHLHFQLISITLHLIDIFPMLLVHLHFLYCWGIHLSKMAQLINIHFMDTFPVLLINLHFTPPVLINFHFTETFPVLLMHLHFLYFWHIHFSQMVLLILHFIDTFSGRLIHFHFLLCWYIYISKWPFW